MVIFDFLIAFPSGTDDSDVFDRDSSFQPVGALYLPFTSDSDAPDKPSENVYVLAIDDLPGRRMLRCNSLVRLNELRDAVNQARRTPWYNCEELLNSFSRHPSVKIALPRSVSMTASTDDESFSSCSTPGIPETPERDKERYSSHTSLSSLSSFVEIDVSEDSDKFISSIRQTGATGFIDYCNPEP